jgi:hypothetical protein
VVANSKLVEKAAARKMAERLRQEETLQVILKKI